MRFPALPRALLRASPNAALARQRGVVLLLSLIILVVLLGASAALVRSFDTSLFVAGNLAFKRDLVNQGERAVPGIMTALNTGVLSTPVSRGANNVVGVNYSATVLPTNVQGIPLALLQTTPVFDGLGYANSANDIPVPAQGVTVRYVMDRMCTAPGEESTILDSCVTSTPEPPQAGDNADRQRAEEGGGGSSPVTQQVVYRLSLRVDGPRDTQAFLQTTFTR